MDWQTCTFGENASRVIKAASQEAKGLSTGPEHLLLGILLGRGPAVAALARVGVSFETARRAIDVLTRTRAEQTKQTDGFTVAAKDALSNALVEARSLNHSVVEPEHILLGLLWVQHGPHQDALKALLRGEDYVLRHAHIRQEIMCAWGLLPRKNVDGTDPKPDGDGLEPAP